MEQLTIRAAGPDDGDAIAGVYGPYVADSVASFELDPPSGGDLVARMAASPRRPWLVAERAGKVVGFAYAAAFNPRPAYDWSVTVSVYLAPSEHRQGIGRALYGRLFEALRALGYVRAYALITEPNPGSTGLHAALGFERVGLLPGVGYKHGGWRDVGWWSLTLQDPPAAPAAVREWRGT